MADFDLGEVIFNGWSPVLALATRGADKVIRIVDFIGGDGEKPTSEINKYIGTTGYVSNIADAVPLPLGPQGGTGATGSTGATGATGAKGDKGDKAWMPTFAIVPYSNGFVMQLYGWVGGEGTAPETGGYWGVTGYVTNIANATVFGQTGPQGTPGISTTNMATNRILGRTTAGVGTPEALEAVGLTLLNNKVYNAREYTNGGIKSIIANNVDGAAFTTPSGSTTGVIRIKLPSSAVTKVNLYKIIGGIRFYQSAGPNNSVAFELSAYPSDPINGLSAVFMGQNAIKYPVRAYGTGSEDRYLYIGDLTSVWTGFTTIYINTIVASINAVDVPVAVEGWEISVETSFTGTFRKTLTETLPRAGLMAYPIEEYNEASAVDARLSNSISPMQAFQNLQKQIDNRLSLANANLRYSPFPAYNNSNGILVQTSVASTSFVFLNAIITGNTGGATNRTGIFTTIQVRNNAPGNTLDNGSGIDYGLRLTVDAFVYGGFVCFWIPNVFANMTFQISVYSANVSGDQARANLVTALTHTAKPTTGVTGSITINPSFALLNNGSSTNLILGDGAYRAVSDFLPYSILNHIAGQGILISTDILSSANSELSISITGVKGGAGEGVINIQTQISYNSSAFSSIKSIAIGGISFDFSVFNYNGFVCIFIPYPGYYSNILVTVKNTNSNLVSSISRMVKPSTGITGEINITPIKSILSDGSAANVILGNGTYLSLADLDKRTAPYFMANGNSGQGVLVKTNTPSSANTALSFFITGTQLSSAVINVQVQLNINASVFYTIRAVAIGGTTFDLSVFILDGFVCFFIPFLGGYTQLYVRCVRDGNNVISSVTNEAKPTTGVTVDTTITPLKSIIGEGTTAQFFLGNGTLANLNTLEPAISAGSAGQYLANGKAWTDFATSVRNALITGYVSGAGTVAATDTILQAIQKLNGNDALKANIATAAVAGTTTAIQFDIERTYGTNAAPMTASSITTNSTGAQVGVTAKLFIQRSTAPTFPAAWKLSAGSAAWHATNVNRVFAQYEDASNIYYLISN